MNQHFLQSTAWQAFQESLGRTTFRDSGLGWEYLAILERSTGNSRLYCPYGPAANDEHSLAAALDSLIHLGKKHHVTFLRVEPTNLDFAAYLQANGWKKVTYQKLQPEHSHVIDLTQPQDQLIAHMAQPVRNVYRNYHKKGVSIHRSTDPHDIDILLKFVHHVARQRGITPHPDSYFRQQAATLFPLGAATLYYATLDDQPIAAALFYHSSNTLYYAHAGASSDPAHRKLNAGTALLAEAIVDAQQRGLTKADLYGIAPDGADKNHPWAGFTKFKRSFGGHDVAFAGAWDLPLQHSRYWLYRAYQTLR